MGAYAAIAQMASQATSQAIGGVSGFVLNRQRAKILEKIGKMEATEARRRGREIGAAQQVGYGKANVRTDVGTPVHVAADTAARAELDALRRLFSYEQEAYETRVEGISNLVQSILMSGSSAGSGVGRIRWAGSGLAVGSSGVNTMSLYGQHGSAVNTIPSKYSVGYGGYA